MKTPVERQTTDPLRVRIDMTAPRPTFVDDPEGDYLVSYSPEGALVPEVNAAWEALWRDLPTDDDPAAPEVVDIIARHRSAIEAAVLGSVAPPAPHLDEPHEFRTTCLRCGESGLLHVSLITPDETVTIAPWPGNAEHVHDLNDAGTCRDCGEVVDCGCPFRGHGFRHE